MAVDPWITPSARAERELHADVAGRTDEAGFIARVYRWMALGLGLTGFIAMAVASSPSIMRTIFGNPVLYLGLIIGQLALVWVFSSIARSASFSVAAAMFLTYCALTGVTFSVIFLVYTRESIASTFFITGGAFGAMSAYGTLTKKDLSSWSGFLMMGLVGVILAGIVNFFVGSSALSFVISCASVIVFTGLTAYDTQKIRGLAEVGDDRLALTGALHLYLDFINLFLALLRLFGRRR
jgi:FtsH-binding integral membrane protein